ncbi:ATP-binding protein [Ramlibacter sp.]|uniref:ATP-binding protein n=1 Tax=Ramlibacter sp. TaxID=1917967 RepID=UPI003D0DC695
MKIVWSPRLLAAAVAAAYLVVGAGWIVFSDRLGEMLFASAAALGRYQTLKGWFFIGVTALVLFYALDRRERNDSRDGGGILASRLRGVPISMLLAGLVVATAVPTLGLLAHTLIRQTAASIESSNQLVRRVAESTALDIRHQLQVHQRLFAAVMAEGGEAPDCSDIINTTARLEPQIVNVVLFAGDRVTCAMSGDEYQPLPAGWTGEAPIVSAPFRSRHGGAWLVAVTHGPRSGLTGSIAVQLVLPAATFMPALRGPLADGSATTLVHDSGVILARWPEGGATGSPVRDLAAFEQMRSGRATVAMGFDRIERVYAMRAVDNAPLHVIAGLPSDHVYGAARELALRGAVVAGVVLLLSGLLIACIVRALAGPLRALSATARRVAAGDFTQRAPVAGATEVAAVAEQFNALVETLPKLRKEIALHETRQRELLANLSRNVPGVIFQFRMMPDGGSTVPWVSGGIVRMFEISADDAAKSSAAVLERVHPADRDRLLGEMTRQGALLAPCESVFRVNLPMAGERHYMMRANPEPEPDGVVLWYGYTVDVTDDEHAREALLQAKQTLEQRVEERTRELKAANDALESFSSSAAHDLRAPLGAIKGFTTAVEESLARGKSDKVGHYLARTRANVDKMEALVEGLLSLARIAKPLQESQVDLGRMVGEIVADMPSAAETVVEPLPRVNVDPVLMRQVFHNLLANAVKFTAAVPEPRIRVHATLAPGEIAIAIEDNGIGFDAAFAHRLFEPLARLHSHVEGSGLGLSIVRRIVERHGGGVRAAGETGRGAVFTFTLPLARVVDADAGSV